jgi:hypothetical protein
MVEINRKIAEFSKQMIIRAVETINPLDNQHNIDFCDIDEPRTEFFFELDNEYSSGNVIQGKVMLCEGGELMGFIMILDLLKNSSWNFSFVNGVLMPTSRMRWGNV